MSDQNAETQLMALRDYCSRMNYFVVDEYVDNGFSGKDTNRGQKRLISRKEKFHNFHRHILLDKISTKPWLMKVIN